MPLPTDRHQRLGAVFDEALLLEAVAREAYLDDACAGDPELRAHVVRLLSDWRPRRCRSAVLKWVL